MRKTNAIFIFTKNRPDYLSKSLARIRHCGKQIFVIDDSSIRDSIIRNKSFCHLQNNIFYHGLLEQKQLLQSVPLPLLDQRFFQVLGSDGWNLGYARNHALLLSTRHQVEKAIFLDDDIAIDNLGLLNELFDHLDTFDFVGADITGMPDDSVLGHIATQVGLHFEKMLSGGCLAFKPPQINYYFLNLYNEDWIWLYFETMGKPWTVYGTVQQMTFDPFINFQAKVPFQEPGELIVDAIQSALQSDNLCLLKNEGFWYEMITERVRYLSELYAACHNQNKSELEAIIQWLMAQYTYPSAHWFTRLFTRFFQQSKRAIQIRRALPLC